MHCCIPPQKKALNLRKKERPKAIYLGACIMLRVKDICACTRKHTDRHSQCKTQNPTVNIISFSMYIISIYREIFKATYYQIYNPNLRLKDSP